MSFNINWESIGKDSLSSWTKDLLNDSLNTGKRPNALSSDIKIIDLNFGSQAPDFEILEIGDLGPDRFRGIFKFNYQGDASITLNTKVQANPLKIFQDNLADDLTEIEPSCEFSNFATPKFVMANDEFSIPLNIRLSKIKLSSIIIIVFSKTKGLTLVFKNDPLESISINSTFDKIKPLANFIQKKIETQISELFKEFLPNLLYKFSLQYTVEKFDQFHQDLLAEHHQHQQENRVNFNDIDPERPLQISSGSLERLASLARSRQTLAMGQSGSADNMNPDLITKNYLNAIMLKSMDYGTTTRVSINDMSFRYLDENLDLIKEFQSRAFFRNGVNNNSSEITNPKRRVIKLGKRKQPKQLDPDISLDEEREPETPNTSEETLSEQTIKHPTPIKQTKEFLPSPLYSEMSKPRTPQQRPSALQVPFGFSSPRIDKLDELKINSRRAKLDQLMKRGTNDLLIHRGLFHHNDYFPPPPYWI